MPYAHHSKASVSSGPGGLGITKMSYPSLLGFDEIALVVLEPNKMDAEQEIKDAQQAWASSKGIPFDSRGYVPEVEANLWQPLSSRARQSFERGAGSELSGHMRALHSSSALAVNLFDHWTDRDKTPILSAMGVEPAARTSLDFEAQFPTGLGGIPPHVDVAITHSTSFVVGVEAKFTEHLKRSTRGKSDFKASYFPDSEALWCEKGLPACQALAEELWAEELRCGRQRFEYLYPRQLLKHALGLATRKGNRFSLYYLYYDWTGKRPEAHRREVDLFDERVGDEIRFRALTLSKGLPKAQGFRASRC